MFINLQNVANFLVSFGHQEGERKLYLKQKCLSSPLLSSSPWSVSSSPGPGPASPAPPAPAPAPVPGAGRTLVAVLGVWTVPAEVSPLPTLVTPHVGVKPPPTPPPCPGPGHAHSPPPAADVLTVSSPASLVRVLTFLEDDECKAGNTFGHPDLDELAVLVEHFLQVPLAGPAVQVGHVQPLSLQLLRLGARPRP